jgi:DNA-binding transcriptional ArsR family regulator
MMGRFINSVIPNYGNIDSLDFNVKSLYDSVMRPLFHPSLSEITVQGILYALSDPVRVSIFVELMDTECAKNCSAFAKYRKTTIPKSTLSQHFKILREAGLIRSVRKGVELQNQDRLKEISKKFGPMITEILKAYAAEE